MIWYSAARNRQVTISILATSQEAQLIMSRTLSPYRRIVALILAFVVGLSLVVSPAHARDRSEIRATSSGVSNIDGYLTLSDDASTPSPSFGAYDRIGMYDAAPITFSSSFNRITIRYQRTAPQGTSARVDVRMQAADGRWTEWETDVQSGANVRFSGRHVAAQYRVILLGSIDETPAIGAVSFTERGFERSLLADGAKTAPTYRLRVTRQGMVGGRTANGHIITENDFFVSLPSRRALSSLDGQEYKVRLSANGRSVVVPVMDVGPWNTRDDYWNANRQMYKDLPAGWPEDHAAYFENYNDGVAEKGVVRYPTAVDIGDGAYWALGLEGAQATVNVTFLWMGTDPGPAAQPLNSHPSKRPAPPPIEPQPTPTPEPTPPPTPTPPPEPITTINDTDVGYSFEGTNVQISVDSCAYAGQARWTYSTGDKGAAYHGLWRPSLRGGMYDVYAYIPACGGDSALREASYIIQYANNHTEVPVDQVSTAGTWVHLGRFPFAAGDAGYVQLRGQGGEKGNSVWFDAVKWVPVASN